MARPLGTRVKYGVFFLLTVSRVVLHGLAEKSGRGRALQDHLPGRAAQPCLAPWTLFAGPSSGCPSSSSARSQIHLPAGRCARHAQHLPLVWFKPQAGLQQLSACAVGCGSLAIDADGRIDHRECLHCLDCMILYRHQRPPAPGCRKKRREKDGLEITPIGANAAFHPIDPPRRKATPADQPGPNAPDPRMPTEPTPGCRCRRASLKWIRMCGSPLALSTEGFFQQPDVVQAVCRVIAGRRRHGAWVMTALGYAVVRRSHSAGGWAGACMKC